MSLATIKDVKEPYMARSADTIVIGQYRHMIEDFTPVDPSREPIVSEGAEYVVRASALFSDGIEPKFRRGDRLTRADMAEADDKQFAVLLKNGAVVPLASVAHLFPRQLNTEGRPLAARLKNK